MVKSSNRRTKKKTSASRSHTKQKGSGLFDMFGNKGAMTGTNAAKYLQKHPEFAKATSPEVANKAMRNQLAQLRQMV